MSTVVLIPARDEGPRVGGTVAAVRRALPGVGLLVVDGGSRDDTRARAEAAGAQVIGQEGSGYAGALLTGYRHLLRGPVQRVIQLDADGQHPPQAAPLLLGALGESHLVMASRHGTPTGGAWTRRAGNHLLSVLVRRATGRHLHDVTSGYWAFDRQALEILAAHLPLDCADANVRILAVRSGLNPLEIPVVMAPRASGRSMHEGWRGLANFGTSLRRALEASRQALPMAEGG